MHPKSKKFCTEQYEHTPSLAAPIVQQPVRAPIGVSDLADNSSESFQLLSFPPQREPIEICSINWLRAFNKIYCIITNIPHGATLTRQFNPEVREVVLTFNWTQNRDAIVSWLATQEPTLRIPSTSFECRDHIMRIPYPAEAIIGVPKVIEANPTGVFGFKFTTTTSVAPEQALDLISW